MNNSYEHYEDDLPDSGEYANENLVTSQELAEKQLRCLKYWEEEERMALHHYQKELDRIELWKAHKINRINKKKQWHEHGLHCYLEQNGKKKIDLIHGTIKKTKGREVLVVEDPAKFDDWFIKEGFSAADFYITKRTPSRDLIKRYVKENGEIPEGCIFERKPEKISIEIREELDTAPYQEVTEIVSDDEQIFKGESLQDHKVVRHESLQDIPFT